MVGLDVGEVRESRREGLLLGAIDTVISSAIVMVSWVSTDVKAFQIVHIKMCSLLLDVPF